MKGLLIAAATAIVVVGAVWLMNAANGPHGTPPDEASSVESPRETHDEELGSRDRILRSTAQQLGVTPIRGVWGVVMERGYPKGTATIVALADGTASMYISTGASVLGGKSYGPAHGAALKMCDAAADVLAETITAPDFPVPAKGRVRFYVLTADGVRVAETAILAHADAGKDALASLSAAGDAVLDALKDATSKGLIR